MGLKSRLRTRLGTVRQWLVRVHHRLVPLEWEIARALAGRREVFFVQVGSNDGTSGDPLHKLLERHGQWRGIFIEPVPSLFERLKANHPEAHRYVFENVAIGKERGEAVFHYVSEDAKAALGDKLPYWYDQLGSFDRQHILKHLDGLLEPYIVSQPLPCLPLQDVFDRNGVKALHLLHIDTEGYDYQVLSQFDFARYQPKVVLYEHKHLSKEDRRSAEALLRRHGYRLQVRSADTLARR
jgi:FkbM family methyltransferase